MGGTAHRPWKVSLPARFLCSLVGGFCEQVRFSKSDSACAWQASVDDAAPPSPRLWSWQGVTDPEEDAIDMRRQQTRASYPDVPGQGWDEGAEASWREQDPEEQSYTWQLGRGLGGRDSPPLDE